jgi:hypothetical protein
MRRREASVKPKPSFRAGWPVTCAANLLKTPAYFTLAEHLQALIVLSAQVEDLFRRIEINCGQNNP